MERVAGLEPALQPWEGCVPPLTLHSHESPSPVSSRATTPYQGAADTDPKGMSWPGWIQTSVVPGFKRRTRVQKPRRPCQQSNRPSGASGRTRTDCLPLTRRLLWPGELQRHRAYARRDSNPHQHGPQPCPSTRLRHERMRAATRCRPGSSAVRRRSRSRARRQSCRSRIRTCTYMDQNHASCPVGRSGME